MPQLKCNVTDFFAHDYVDQASYDNLRKIASAIDGLKNASRKIIHTVLDKKIYHLLKVQQLSATVAEYTDYLHGSLDGVVVTLGQNQPGSNQLPLLTKKGNFGTRSLPTPSAARYIFAYGSKCLPTVFRDEDRPILVHQVFEGKQIEPKFFVPTLPLILVNGSRGISSGFSQNILPRETSKIVEVLKKRCQGKIQNFEEVNSWTPYILGFRGSVVKDGDQNFKWIIQGHYHWAKERKNQLIIDELPLDVNPRDFVKFLEGLKDEHVIKDFDDCCEGNELYFAINLPVSFNTTSLDIIETFKLNGKVTENFTCLNENNVVQEFKSPAEILEYFYSIKLKFMQARKDYELNVVARDLEVKKSKLKFMEGVLNHKINLKDFETVESLKSYLAQEHYADIDDYKYITGITMAAMTKENVQKLKDEMERLQQKQQHLQSSTVEQLYLEDLDDLKWVSETESEQ